MYLWMVKDRSKNLWKSCLNSISSQNYKTPFHCNHLLIENPLKPSSIPKSLLHNYSKVSIRQQSCFLYNTCRLYSSDGKGSRNESTKKPIQEEITYDEKKLKKEEVKLDAKNSNEHARLGEQDQKEWIDSERLSFDSKHNDSPFLSRRDRFKNEFKRRIVPWEKIQVSFKNFPYFIDEHTKSLLMECAISNLKNQKFATSYGSRLCSSSGRILLQSNPGMELYKERLVKALAHDLQVPLLTLDSSVLAPYDFGRGCASESGGEEDNDTSGEECSSESELEGDNEENIEETSESDDENVDVRATAEALKKLVPSKSMEEFVKRVSEELDGTEESTPTPSEHVGTVEETKRPLQKGDRVKYIGESVKIEADKRPLPNGQRGEVYEVNGDQVAVILDNFDNMESNPKEGDKVDNFNQDGKPSVYWFSIRDIVQDHDTEAEDWYIAMEALFEVLPSLQPLIIYIPDSTEWLSRAAPNSHRKEFVSKVEEMLNKIAGPVILICGQNIVETGTKQKEKLTVVLPHLGRLPFPIPLKQLSEGLKAVTKSARNNDISKLFPNILFINPPKEEELLRTFHKQIEADRIIVLSRNNLIALQKVLEEHELSCPDLLLIKTDDIFLTKEKAEKVIGWAKNHYLSSIIVPTVKSKRLMIPRESLEIAISRLRKQESVSSKSTVTLKSLARDEYETNFVSAVVPPEEIGVKFDDIGALEDVKTTLNELVTLPMRRPELFARGNLLRPCKGILLFGPPGTGKTLLAKALATEAGANFISITGSTLTSKWFGDAEKLTKALFSFATRLAPVIIFVDEVDSLLGARGGSFEHEATRRMRNEFMAAWDGLRSKDSQRILILGATNRPFDLDDAVIRRLPRRIYVDLPDAENRKKILKILLSKENLEQDFRYDELANATEGYSGSDLKNLCIAAAYRPVQELIEEEKKHNEISATPSLRSLNLEDFIQAKSKVGASVAYDAASMNELRKWNEMYGEGGSRKKTPFGFGD